MDRSTTLDDRSTTLDGVKSIAITAATTAADPSDTDPGEIGQNPAPPSFWLRNPLDLGRLGKKKYGNNCGADFGDFEFCIPKQERGKRGEDSRTLDVRGDLDFCCMVKTMKKYKRH